VLSLGVDDIPLTFDLQGPRHVTLHHPPEFVRTSKAFERIK
jgi:hypothetical protein